MKNNWNMEKSPRSLHYDHFFVAATMLLLGVGLVTLYSGSYAFASRFFGDRYYFILRQGIFAIAGIIGFIVISRVSLERIRALVIPLVVITAILSACAFLPIIGVTKNGASRWIRLGSFTYQPSELVKFVLPLYLAHYLDKKQDKIDSFMSGVFPPVIITSVFFALIYFQNNFSTAVFIAFNALVIFFLAGVKMRFFISATVIMVPVSFLLVLTKEHRLRRVLSFIWPDMDPLGAGYQVRASILTLESGGFLGKGIGQGTRKISSIPEVSSDFLFSAYSEEAGFLGVMLFMALITVFFLRSWNASVKRGDTFGKLLCAGLGTMIISQTLVNLAVISGTVPATGIPLPFFSAGGSSLFTTLLMAGIIANIGKSEEQTLEY
jgi:cell division protein FtsW